MVYRVLFNRTSGPRSLQKHPPGVLNVLLHLDEELHSLPAIQQTVVVGKSQVHHGSDLDLAVDSNGALLDGVEAKNGALGKVDDGSAHERAENAAVADGEGTTSHILDRKLAIAGLINVVSYLSNVARMSKMYLLAHVGNGLLNANHVHSLNVSDNGGNETLFSGNSNADVDVVAVDNGVTAVRALNGSIDGGEVPHSENTGAGEGAHETKLDAGLLENVILVQLAEVHNVGHVDLVEGGKRSSGVLGLLKALGDSETHAVHLDLRRGLAISTRSLVPASMGPSRSTYAALFPVTKRGATSGGSGLGLRLLLLSLSRLGLAGGGSRLLLRLGGGLLLGLGF